MNEIKSKKFKIGVLKIGVKVINFETDGMKKGRHSKRNSSSLFS